MGRKAALLVVAVLVTTAGSAPPALAGEGPSVGLDSIALLPPESGARADLRIVLTNVPIPRHGRGTIVLFHPNNEPATVTIKSREPRGGFLLVCPVDGGTTARDEDACVRTAATGVPLAVSVDVPSGAPHVGLEFIGTWKRRVSIDQIDIRYKNVDYFFTARFSPN